MIKKCHPFNKRGYHLMEKLGTKKCCFVNKVILEKFDRRIKNTDIINKMQYIQMDIYRIKNSCLKIIKKCIEYFADRL